MVNPHSSVKDVDAPTKQEIKHIKTVEYERKQTSMTKHNKNGKYKTVVIGDYVFTPIKNQFNDKTAYWLSKKHYTSAFYCFTVSCTDDLKMLDDNKILDSYIKYFDSRVNMKKSA